MKTFCIVLLAFLQISHAHLMDKASKPPLSFIVKGEDAKVGEFPYMLLYKIRNLGIWTNLCGASLINPQQALTAAHCVDQIQLVNMEVTAGLHDYSKTNEGQKMTIKKVVMHPDYKDGSSFYANDIAILTFTEPVELNDKVQFIKWNQDNSFPSVGEECEITGWGYVNGPIKTVLQKVKMNVISNRECANKIIDFHHLVLGVSNICVFRDGYGGCKKDSGGPLICQKDGRSILVGTTSWGASKRHSCNNYNPTVYVRTSPYTQFILANLEE